MTLVHMVYWVLMVECIVLSMLCLPYVRNVVTYLGRFIPVQAIKWYEAFRKMYNYQLKRKALDPNDPHFLDEKEALEPHRLRAERDAYICGFALFFCFVIPMVYQLALEAQSKARAQPAAAKTAPEKPASPTGEREHED